MAANYAQSLRTGVCMMVNEKQSLVRDFNLQTYTYCPKKTKFFPLDTNPAFRLGSHFAVYSLWYPGEAKPNGQTAYSRIFIKLISHKNSHLEKHLPTRLKQTNSYFHQIRRAIFG